MLTLLKVMLIIIVFWCYYFVSCDVYLFKFFACFLDNFVSTYLRKVQQFFFYSFIVLKRQILNQTKGILLIVSAFIMSHKFSRSTFDRKDDEKSSCQNNSLHKRAFHRRRRALQNVRHFIFNEIHSVSYE